MLVRWRGLLHSTSSRTNSYHKTIRNPSSAIPFSSQPHLSSEIIDSTVSNCPSDTIALTFFLWAARQPNYFHAPSSFDRLTSIVLRLSERFGLVSSIVRHLESFGCPIKAQTYLMLLRIYWRAKKSQFTLEVFDEMRRRNYEPNTFARNIVLDIMFKLGRFDEAMRVFRETQFPNFLTFNIVLRYLCESGDWIGVRDLLREMTRKGFCFNEGTFLISLDCFCKAGRHTIVLQVLAFMIALGRGPCVTIWTILIDSFCRNGRVDIACDHLRNMVEAGCPPTVVTYTSLMKGLHEAQMIGERKIEPDSYTISSLAFIFLSSRKIGFLLELTRGLKFKDDLVFYNSLINGYCKAGLASEALMLYNVMIDRGLIPDSFSYVGLLSSLCKVGRFEDAIHAYHMILINNLNVDAYVHSAILDGLVKNRKYHEAIKLFRKAIFGNYCMDAVSYTIAIHALFKGGRFEEAHALFEHMKHFGPTPNVYTYNVMLHGLRKCRDLEGTKKVIKDMLITGIEMDCISKNVVSLFLIKLGRIDSILLY